MEREIARLRPANVSRVAVRTPAPATESFVVTGRNKAEVIGRLQYMARQGVITRQYEPLAGGAGEYRVRVQALPRPEPRWARLKVRHAVIMTVVAAATVALAWAVKVFVAAVLSLIPVLLGATVVIGLMFIAGGGRSIQVVQKVTIRR